MGQLENWKMTPLDSLLCSNQLQILKSLVFFFPPSRQRQMIFLVKLMELRQCLSLPLSPMSIADPSHHHKDSPAIFESIFPYCDREKQQFFQQMQQAFQMMNTVQQFSAPGMFEQFSDLMGGDKSSSMFSSVMTPDQQALVAQYEAMLDEL